MAQSSGRMPRLYLESRFASGDVVVTSPEQSHYLLSVLRLTAGAPVLVFNGEDGEWRARIGNVGKKSCDLILEQETWPQLSGPDIDYIFAPLKRARLDYMVQKATELGARRLRPVMTEYTQSTRVNMVRMRANAIEAAEQCGLVSVPEIFETERLGDILGSWPDARSLIFCDESAELRDPVAALGEVPEGPVAVLIGPEGGFSSSERAKLLAKDFVTPLSLGPRIMRSDTAAIAALSLVNAVHGDWR